MPETIIKWAIALVIVLIIVVFLIVPLLNKA